MNGHFKRREKSPTDHAGRPVDRGSIVEIFYSGLLDKIWSALPARPSGAIIQVCSSQVGDGATTIAVQLSRLWASSSADARTLLIDAAMQSPSLHQLEGLPNAPGLREVLSREVSLDQVVHRVGPGNLSVITTGEPWQLASTLFPEWEKLAAQLREQYTLTVVDSGSLDLESTAAVLGAACDGIILVVRAGKTQRKAAMRAAGLLKDTGRLLGVVLNDATVALPRWLRRSFT